MGPIRFRRFTLRKMLFFVGVGTLFLFLLVYVTYQARSLIEGPEIVLGDAGVYTPLQHEQVMRLVGSTSNIVKLEVNGKEIYTDKEGHFDYGIVLEKGYSIVTLRAEDRFGRTTSVTREYVYVPKKIE